LVTKRVSVCVGQTMAKQATDEGKFDAAIALLEQAQKLKAEL
jgi:hypothetical protein